MVPFLEFFREASNHAYLFGGRITYLGIYVTYDFIKLNNIKVQVPIYVLHLSFFTATLSALIHAWLVYKR